MSQPVDLDFANLTLDEFMEYHVRFVMQLYTGKGRLTKAADALGISMQTLRRKLKKWDAKKKVSA